MSLPLKSHVDILIIGAGPGPAGLIAAAWASRYAVSCRIVDRNPQKVQTGHADGLRPRTLEIFDSFGAAESPMKEGFHVVEICSWNPDDNGRIRRSQRLFSQRKGASAFPQVALNQGAIEECLNKFLEYDGQIRVERNVSPQDLHLDRSIVEDSDAYPITLKVRRAAGPIEATDNGCSTENGKGSQGTQDRTHRPRTAQALWHPALRRPNTSSAATAPTAGPVID